MRPRIAVSAAIGLASGVFCWFLMKHLHQDAADFRWTLHLAHRLLARQNPYDTRLEQYPLTAAFFALPFLRLPPEVAAGAFWGISSALLAFGLTREGYRRLIVFLAYPYWAGILTVQWSPIVAASAFFPLLLPVTMAKPQIGLPVFLTHLSRRGLIACAVLAALSLAVMPNWPLLWIHQLGNYQHFIPLLVLPGPLLALALLRYRDRDGWLLFLSALMPQRWFFDTFILWLIPKSRREIIWTVFFSWGVGIWRWYHFYYTSTEIGRWTVVFLYLPMLAVLFWRGRDSVLRASQRIARTPRFLPSGLATIIPCFSPTSYLRGIFMKPIQRIGKLTLLSLLLTAWLLVAFSSAQTTSTAADLSNERPAKLVPVTSGFDYTKRDVMIPMRDGVKLHTVILIPNGAKSAPILLTRTPYSATGQTSHRHSSHLGPSLDGYDNAVDVIVGGGYIRVIQDIRGKYGSEGDYVMTRPLHGPLNPTPVDHSTDTYDTIDWLVKNIPESNGKVGILGISYDGFLPLMALVNPHPALKVAVPMNPMVDGWMGDDWFHNGAFRQQGLPYIYEQEATRSNDEKWWTNHFDDYDVYMEAGSAGELGRRHGAEQVGFWRKILEHPSYDAYWQQQAMDRILATQPLKVPTMIVASLWDQEDIYGATALYKALKPKDANNDKIFLVMGPWHHGQEIDDASTLGALKFGSDTGLYFRTHILRPFLDHYLQNDEPEMNVPTVSAFETGTNKWLELPSWPAGCRSACPIRPTPLYLSAGFKLGFAAPKTGDTAFEEYVSDPAKPVPYRARPIQSVGYGDGMTWSQWLVDDQREESGRPDVVTFLSDVLTAPVKISGQPVANLVASTSGTDSDWVVKLIDVYPDEVAGQPNLGGYQLMISADIFRGRYRESLETAKPIPADQPLLYRFNLPTANHVFLPGHRMMVQIQSSWFPLYDRNPQAFVPNIFWAKPGDYRKAVQRIYHAPDHASFIELPVVEVH